MKAGPPLPPTSIAPSPPPLSEKMAENLKEEIKLENVEIKEEIEEEILPSSSTVEETYSIFMKEEDVKFEISETKGEV